MTGLHCVWDLDDPGKDDLASMGFGFLLDMPHIQANHGLLTALAERWHSEHDTFHLPTGEATITLEDVYQILQVPSHGDPVSIIMFLNI